LFTERIGFLLQKKDSRSGALKARPHSFFSVYFSLTSQIKSIFLPKDFCASPKETCMLMNRPSGASFLGDMLGDMLAALLERSGRRGQRRSQSIEAMCDALLAEQNEASSLLLAADILHSYEGMTAPEKTSFFTYINEAMDIDPAALAAAASTYMQDRSVANYEAVKKAGEPLRYEFLRRLNAPPAATGGLVRMRADLLGQLAEHPDLARSDADFVRMLRSWFNRGFLILRQITWDTPASILEKIIAYEAVHAINSWEDLRQRLQPDDRRCFAFFHPAMPQEPLIFVEVALAKGVPGSIQGVLAAEREMLEAAAADSAVFYSISNCQKGLAGISFGNSLIKQVVRDLSIELPNIRDFLTLSPIPGLRGWAAKEAISIDSQNQEAVTSLAAHYLVSQRGKTGQPLDPVARFHLSNGAQILAINPQADLSKNGLAQSWGVMVNYRYEPDRIAENLRLLHEKDQLAMSAGVRALAQQGAQLIAS
jgi:malonyl-CoA decarboxylase